jgi:hypothetical protein
VRRDHGHNWGVQIRIVATELPGRDCMAGDNFPGYSNIHVGVQAKNPREASHFTMFRRAKVMLAEVPGDVLAAAAASGSLVGTLGLTNAKGHPLCARVTPPKTHWSSDEGRP